MAPSSPISNITSSSSSFHHHHHHHNQISILDDDVNYNNNTNNNNPLLEIEIVLNLHYKTSYQGIIINQSTKSFPLTLQLLLENPQLIDSYNIYDLLWDQAMEELEDLEVDYHLRPRIIHEIASAFLRSTDNGDHDRTLISLDVEIIVQEDNKPNKDVIKSLLISGGMTLLPSGGMSSCCAICLEEAVSCECDRGDDEEELLVAGKLSCKHVYHVECLLKWVLNCGTNTSYTTPSCPLCRLPLFAASTKQT